MTGIFGIFVFLFTLVVSLIIIRLVTVILTFTGLSWEVARFQARSAFPGTGITTDEAESVVNHPVRRRIVMLLMLVRSAGFITLITSLMFSFMDGAAEQTRIVRFILLISGVVMIWAIFQSKPVERILNHLIATALRRWTDLDARDYASVLKLSGGFSVMELLVRHNDWMAGSRLKDLQLPREGVVVLGTNRQDGK